MFKSRDSCAVEHEFELENTSNEPRVICLTLYTKNLVDQTDHFTDFFGRENVAYGYDVVTPIWRSKTFSRRLSVMVNLKPVSIYTSIIYTHFKIKKVQ